MRLFVIFAMIFFILVFGSFIIHSQTESCEVCIIDSTCTDEKIYFNVSISKYCQKSLNTHFTYHTDVNSKPYHYNTTSTCSNCFISISIDPIRDAWDYTLTLKSPKPSQNCPTEHVAHCGGQMSKVTLLIVGGLSGLAILLGVLLCSLKHYRGQTGQMIIKQKNYGSCSDQCLN
jgi:hypothetical protein